MLWPHILQPIIWAFLLDPSSASAIPPILRHTPQDDEDERLQTRDENVVLTDPKTGAHFMPGETSRARTIFTLVALTCAVILSTLFGLRARTLARNMRKKHNLTSFLTSFLFLFGILFIFATAVVESGQSLANANLCYTAIIICLVFYTNNKLAIYIFLLERARIVRAPFMRRYKDWLWISGMFIICGGFGTVAVIGYVFPVADLSDVDHRCRIGLPRIVAVPLMCFDIGLNFLFTGLFIWLLRPVISLHNVTLMPGKSPSKRMSRTIRVGSKTPIQCPTSQVEAANRTIKVLLWKCLIGSTGIMLPTVGNMVLFYIMRGRELGWICLTICTLDVSWGVLIVNWLTVGSAKAEKELTTLLSQQTVVDRDGPVPVPILESRLSDLGDRPRPAVLQDEGKLLAVNTVSFTSTIRD